MSEVTIQQIPGFGKSQLSHTVNILTKDGIAPVTLTAPAGFRFESILSGFDVEHNCAKILLRVEKIR